jgi:hypothetical protein
MRRALLVLASVAVVAACSGPPGTTPGPTPPASPVEGVVIEVDARGLSQIRGFALRTSDGPTLRFRIDGLENPVEFPPAHLSEHRTTSEPVRVFFRVVGGELVAYRLEDAAEEGIGRVMHDRIEADRAA